MECKEYNTIASQTNRPICSLRVRRGCTVGFLQGWMLADLLFLRVMRRGDEGVKASRLSLLIHTRSLSEHLSLLDFTPHPQPGPEPPTITPTCLTTQARGAGGGAGGQPPTRSGDAVARSNTTSPQTATPPPSSAPHQEHQATGNTTPPSPPRTTTGR